MSHPNTYDTMNRLISFFIVVMCLPNNMVVAFTSTGRGSSSPSSSFLYMSKKSSDRAHIERNLEDMMDNNWREFRAKLVAQEQVAANMRHEVSQQLYSSTIPTTTTPSHLRHHQQSAQSNHMVMTEPNMYYHHAHDVINQNRSPYHPNPYDPYQQPFQSSSLMKDMPPNQSVNDLFVGSINIYDGIRISGNSLQCSDPFVSEDELPIMMCKPLSINKHRWAHAIPPEPEMGSVLISNTMFHQTVVLIISHCPMKGSTGIVINRPLDGDLLSISAQNNHHLDGSLKFAFA